jgi:hypothetical protein
MTVQGLTTIRSGFGPQDTMNRLEAAGKAKGLTVQRWDDRKISRLGSLHLTEQFGRAAAGLR